MADTISAKDLAAKMGVNPKRMRSFIRREADAGRGVVGRCGAGNRYAFSTDEANEIADAYAAYKAKRAEA